MGYEPEIAYTVESWLADLRRQSPDEARLIDDALDRLRADGAAAGPPLVVPVAPDGIIAHLLFTAESGVRAYVFTAATTYEVLRAWLEVAVPAEFPEYGLRVRRE